MGWAGQLLIAVLPAVLANQVVYLPYYGQTYSPYSPLLQYPVHSPVVRPLSYNVASRPVISSPSVQVNPSLAVQVNPYSIVQSYESDTPHGNRRHEVTTKVSYHGNCEGAVANWEEWEGGITADINNVETPAGRSANQDWKVELVWDGMVHHMEVYNGVADRKAGSSFSISPKPWNTRTGVPQKDVKVSIRATFDLNMPRPGLTAVVVNGKYHVCEPGAAPAESPLNTKVAAPRGPHVPWPKRVMGLYILLADDDEEGYESGANWEPELYEWQQESANVLFFTFIHPDTMEVPPSFQKLAASRGSGQPGAVPANTFIMFAIGGYAYSIKPNPWHWLTSKEAAEKMAEKVAEWPDKYGCDGIDLDLEEGAGSRKEAGPNMVHFIRRLKELKPDIIISQPTYGYPQIQAEIDVINASWDDKGNSNNLADSIGLMVYEGSQALQYVKNYANGSGQWQGFPIKVNAPSNTILLGSKGSTSYAPIMQMAEATVKDDLLGIMVWYASVKNGFQYSAYWDASTSPDSVKGYKDAMALFRRDMGI